MAQIIDNDLGRAKDLIAAAVATLGDFKDDPVGPAWVVPHGNSLTVGIFELDRVHNTSVAGLNSSAVR
jgi:hypothetical protein